MSTCLFYTTKSILGWEGNLICRHFSVLSNQHTKIDFLTNKKTDSTKLKIEHLSNIHINNTICNYREYYFNVAKKFNKWIDIYDDIDITPLKNYDALYILGGMYFHTSGISRNNKRCGIFPYDSGQIRFKSHGIHLTNILALLKAHREYNIPLHELAFDPGEMTCDLFHTDVTVKDNYHLYHGYNVPKYDMKRLDSLQYYFKNKINHPLFEDDNDKIYDFTFGYTVMNDGNRKQYIDFIKTFSEQFKVKNLYCKNVLTNHDNTIDGNEYLTKIKGSRFTYMLPSYDNHCFSMYRFIESIQNDCLPLIHSDCNIEDVQNSFNMNLTSLVTENIPSESERIDMLNYYKSKIKFDKGFV